MAEQISLETSVLYIIDVAEVVLSQVVANLIKSIIRMVNLSENEFIYLVKPFFTYVKNNQCHISVSSKFPNTRATLFPP